MLLCAFCLPLVASLEDVIIPAELKSVVAKVPINSTSCSVTCGLGVKLEEMCEVTATGERRNCTLQRTKCLSSWFCGLLHFTVPVGEPFQLSCLASDVVSFGSRDYSYGWRLAQGLITTNDVLFRPFQNPHSILRFSSTQESDAGTYCCDVHMLRAMKLVKRIYFGLRVIQTDLVQLNFDQSLTSEQQLVANEQKGIRGNQTQEEVQEQQHSWPAEVVSVCLMAGGGGMGCVLVCIALCLLRRM
ncbi:TMM81 protein, partial [Galbula dea]|nr:TMM81 protein [Galbula dea]